MNTRILLTLSALTAIVASGQAVTVAFFTTGTPVFDVSPTSFGTTGNGSAVLVSGVSLLGGTASSYYVKMATTPVDFGGAFIQTPTQIDFLSSATSSNPLLTIKFDTAVLDTTANTLKATNTDLNFPDHVHYSGSLVGSEGPTADTSNDLSISYSTLGGGHYSATLTAIGDVQAVPEPASIAALGLGGLALLRRRRRAA